MNAERCSDQDSEEIDFSDENEEANPAAMESLATRKSQIAVLISKRNHAACTMNATSPGCIKVMPKTDTCARFVNCFPQ